MSKSITAGICSTRMLAQLLWSSSPTTCASRCASAPLASWAPACCCGCHGQRWQNMRPVLPWMSWIGLNNSNIGGAEAMVPGHVPRLARWSSARAGSTRKAAAQHLRVTMMAGGWICRPPSLSRQDFPWPAIVLQDDGAQDRGWTCRPLRADGCGRISLGKIHYVMDGFPAV